MNISQSASNWALRIWTGLDGVIECRARFMSSAEWWRTCYRSTSKKTCICRQEYWNNEYKTNLDPSTPKTNRIYVDTRNQIMYKETSDEHSERYDNVVNCIKKHCKNTR